MEALWDASDVSTTVLVAHDYGVSVGQELLARLAESALAVDVRSTLWMNGGLYPELHRPTVGQQMLLDPEHGAELAAAVTQEMFTEGIRTTWGERVPMDDDAVGHIWASMADGDGVPLMHDLLHYVADRREHEQRWCTALEESPLPATFVWGDLDPVSGAHMIERVEARVAGQGRLLVRYSGTEPLLRVMLEGRNEDEIRTWAQEIIDVVREHVG